MYLVKSHPLFKKLYPQNLLWKRNTADTVFLTFDDGPHAEATEFALSELAKYDAKATFFCIGKNVIAEPELYKKITASGHTIGNHSHNHLNGWCTNTKRYLENVSTAAEYIESKLFRPPYGKIKKKQSTLLQAKGYQIVMWDVLSGDFDTKISPEKCWENILQNIEPGSIIVFHDSSKAWERMKFALPKTLNFCKEKNWKIEAL